MKNLWLIVGVVATTIPCSAKPTLHRVQLTLRYEMKQSLSSAPSSSKQVQTQNRFTLTVSDSFYALIDLTRSDGLEPIAAKTRKWQGQFAVEGHSQFKDEDEQSKCDVTGGRVLTRSEMPIFALSPAPMGTGPSLRCQFDFPVKLGVQTVASTRNGNLTSVEALPGAIPPCLESSNGSTVFRQIIEANPPLSRRPKDALGARIYDTFKASQARGEFWLSSPTFFELKRTAPNLYTLEETQAFPFKPSKTETQHWTQSLSLKLAISPP